MARDKITRKAEPTRGSQASAEKAIISIRMPIEVLNFVEGESRSRAAGLGLKGADLEGAINITARTMHHQNGGARSWHTRLCAEPASPPTSSSGPVAPSTADSA